MSKKYVITTNAGGIAETMQLLSSGEAKYFDSLHDALQSLVDETIKMYGRKAFLLSDLTLRYHAFDGRIGCHRFMILIPKHLDKVFDHPQFYRWLLEIDVDVD